MNDAEAAAENDDGFLELEDDEHEAFWNDVEEQKEKDYKTLYGEEED